MRRLRRGFWAGADDETTGSNKIMLDSLRRGAGTWIVKIFLGVLVLSFAVWGIGDIFRVSPDTAVAEVGDIEIGQGEFTTAFNNALSRLQRQFGGNMDAQQARQMGLADETLRSLVNRALYDQATRDLGLAVADDVIRREIATNPAFQGPTGQFDAETFQQVLRQNGMSEPFFLQNRRSDLRLQQLIDSVTLGGHAPKAMVEAILRHQRQRRSVEVLTLKHDALPAPQIPGDDVLESYHEAHLTRYIAPEYRTLSFLVLRPENLLELVSVTAGEVRESYDNRIDEFTVLEAREVEQIRVQAEDKAREISERLAAGGDFLALAKEMAGLGEGQVKLGTVRKGDLPGEVEATIQALKEGEISQPVQGPFGWYLFRVTKLTPGGVRSFEEVAKRIEGEIRLQRAGDALFELTNKVEDALAGGATLEQTAGELDLKVTKVAQVDANGRGPDGKPVAAIPRIPGLLRQAFSIERGEEPRLEETDVGAYYAVRVDAIKPPAPRRLAEIRESVLADWTREARRAAAEKRVEELARKARGGAALPSLAKGAGMSVAKREKLDRRQMGRAAGLSPGVVDEVFAAKLDDVVQGGAVGGEAQVVVRVLDVVEVEFAKSGDELKTLARGLEQSMTDDLLEQFNRGLEKIHVVEVNDRVLNSIFDSPNYR